MKKCKNNCRKKDTISIIILIITFICILIYWIYTRKEYILEKVTDFRKYNPDKYSHLKDKSSDESNDDIIYSVPKMENKNKKNT